ncbi:hypothetical protein [Mycoplasma sp. 1018B]|uniref:hypothetical protein n=1 Tax=Mycoplasma sp. 1018B TaxID=2967302 RepID=UPI00211BA8D4|nr:hypothetical protein [Mycoplasma sp. 1018B]UUM19107.1 hypothetical protein NPA14_02110 [Mycoplasma sp. 1018B]
MVKKATSNDKEKILNLLNQNHLSNLLIIGDICEFGLENDFIKSYIKIINEKIVAYLLIFGNTLLFYDPENNLSWNELEELIKKYNIQRLTISEQMFNHHKNIFNNNKFQINKQFYAKCNKLIEFDDSQVVKAKKNDVKKIIDSKYLITEFADYLNKNKEKEYQVALNLFEKIYLTILLLKISKKYCNS